MGVHVKPAVDMWRRKVAQARVKSESRTQFAEPVLAAMAPEGGWAVLPWGDSRIPHAGVFDWSQRVKYPSVARSDQICLSWKGHGPPTVQLVTNMSSRGSWQFPWTWVFV